jgi:tetratricopeptide (TPR) repeat protein
MSRSRINRGALILLVAALTGSMFMLRQVEEVRGKQATLEEVLYIPSAKTLKRMSLGYTGLLADIYWTRAVQYYGGKHHEEAMRYDLLYPLLDITTDLDPHLIVAYEFGSVFLSQPPPAGAGQPDKAVALVEKGIRANPDYWRLYFTSGFIHYFDRKDYKAAAEAFQRGSRVPHAHPWLKVMAANMAERANDPATAIQLWEALYNTTEDKMIKENAAQHLAALQVDLLVPELEQRVNLFRQRTGRLPSTWHDMIREGLLRGIPLDPTKTPYKLMPDGSVQVEKPEDLPFITKGISPGWKKPPKSR